MLPENFFSSPESEPYFERLSDDLERIKNAGIYYDDVVDYHIKHAEPTFGLIVAGKGSKVWCYWHQEGFVAEFSDREAQEPRVFRRLADAKKRVEKLNKNNNPCLPSNVLWEIVVWTHPETTILHHKEKYAALRRKFPGSPRH